MSTYVMGTNGNFYNADELYHYGVVGMKWGHRKASYYDNKARSHASKVSTSKTRLGKSYHNYRSYRNEVKSGAKTATNQLGKNGVLKSIDNIYGHGAYARAQTAASKYYDRKSTYTKTDLGTSMAKASAYNHKTAAAANNRLHNAKGLVDYGTNYVNAVANRSIKTWSGRTTTTGKRYVDQVITGGVIGVGLDVNYYTKQKANKSSK